MLSRVPCFLPIYLSPNFKKSVGSGVALLLECLEMTDEPGRWITLPEVTGSLLEQALVERQAYRLDAALLLYDAAAVALAPWTGAVQASLDIAGGWPPQRALRGRTWWR